MEKALNTTRDKRYIKVDDFTIEETTLRKESGVHAALTSIKE